MRFIRVLWRHKIAITASTTAIGLTSFKFWSNRHYLPAHDSPTYQYWKDKAKQPIAIESIPKRHEQISKLKQHNKLSSPYDILIIGGGATGSGIALDSVTRGFNTALIEKGDFSSGTSSRSTKLIHGGVRYLEKAILHFDKQEWNLVQEAIAERVFLINITPHLSYPIPIIIPIYDEFFLRGWYNLIKHFIGMKLYDAMAGRDGLLCPSYYLSSPHARNMFPQLKQLNLIGSVVYFDGQHNDSRMNLYIAMTSAHYGATIANHVEIVDLIKNSEEKIIGVRLRDTLNGEEWNTYAKVIINATGPFVDNIRRLDDPHLPDLIIPSQGTHLVLPGTFTPKQYGLLIPKTADNRVAFILPWEGVALAGTTDKPCDLTELPRPTIDEAEMILTEMNRYLAHEVDISDVDAAWSGIRPLARIPKEYDVISTGRFDTITPKEDYLKSPERKLKELHPKSGHSSRHLRINNNYNIPSDISPSTSNKLQQFKQADSGNIIEEQLNKDLSTSKISRNHLIEILPSGLVTITGGKWTTYRRMAQDVLDKVCEQFPVIGAHATECVSEVIKLIGAAGWTQSVPAILERHQIPTDIAQYLSRNYGDKAFIVGNLYLTKYNKRLAGGYPYTEAEVVYCCNYEMAETAIDILARRTRLALLNKAAAEYALPRIIELMGQEHKWDTRIRVLQYHDACEFLRTMHMKDRHKWGRNRHTVDYARRVVESVLNGPSMTDEAIQFVIDKFNSIYIKRIEEYEAHDGHITSISNNSKNAITNNNNNDNNNNNNKEDIENNDKKQREQRKLFEGCISRKEAYKLAEEFAEIFGDDRVIDAVMFSGLEEIGLYEILVSCAACAADPQQFDLPGPWNMP